MYHLSNIRKKFSQCVNIFINHNQENDTLLVKLKTLSNQHLGSCKLMVHLKAENGNIQKIRARNLSVEPNVEFIQNLRNLLGEKNVWIIPYYTVAGRAPGTFIPLFTVEAHNCQENGEGDQFKGISSVTSQISPCNLRFHRGKSFLICICLCFCYVCRLPSTHNGIHKGGRLESEMSRS